MKQQYIETGRITGTHGIRGELRVQPWCDAPEDLARYSELYLDNQGAEPIYFQRVRVQKSMVLAKAKGIDTIEQAEALRDKILYVNRSALSLEPGQYLIADLIGCQVYHSQSGQLLGALCQVSKTGANDVWHIAREGKEYLIPAIPSVVDKVNIDENRIDILPLKGIFDDED